MKPSSIKKRLHEPKFAPGINRQHILQACEGFGVTPEEHIANLISYFAELPPPVVQ
jgi:predicted hydrolase (HD superfamily)